MGLLDGGVAKIWHPQIGRVAKILSHRFPKIGTPPPPVINDNPLRTIPGFILNGAHVYNM